MIDWPIHCLLKSLKSSVVELETHLEAVLREERLRRRTVFQKRQSVLQHPLFRRENLENDVDGNLVLFISEDDLSRDGLYFGNYQPRSLQLISLDIKSHLISEMNALERGDPLRHQVELFIEDMNTIFSETAPPVPRLHGQRSTFDTAPIAIGSSQDVHERRIEDLRDRLRGVCEPTAISKTSLRHSNVGRDGSGKMNETQDHNSKYEDLAIRLRSLEEKSKYMITTRNFEVGDAALFLPTVRKGIWSLFNINSPHFFLHRESYELIEARDGKQVEWVVGKISRIERSESRGKVCLCLGWVLNATQRENPYRIPAGIEYFEVWAERLDECGNND